MEPEELGKKYDKIARWWNEQHLQSSYGITQLERAIRYCRQHGTALDVGCGSGGRMIRKLLDSGFTVTGIDVSIEMIALAKAAHEQAAFQVADICVWQSSDKYDLVLAWDSIFHLPLSKQAEVVAKLCQLLQPGGILLYTFGDATGEHLSDWHNDRFPYSSIGISGNLQVIMDNGCECRHLELDQFPEKHVYLIAQKPGELVN